MSENENERALGVGALGDINHPEKVVSAEEQEAMEAAARKEETKAPEAPEVTPPVEGPAKEANNG